MIADTCLLSSSPINLQLFEDHEWNFPENQILDESPEIITHWNELDDFEVITSGTTSMASSEGEDDLISEFTTLQERLFEGLIDNENFVPTIHSIENKNTSGNNSSAKLDWSNRIDNDSSPCSRSTSSSSQTGNIPNCPSSSSPSLSPSGTRKRKPSPEFIFCTMWSTMNLREQVKSVERLMALINEKMGLREQLEITRLINPINNNANSGTFFTIDVSYIDDLKWGEVLEHVRQRLKSNYSQETSPSKKSKKMSAILKSQQKAIRQRQKKEYSQQLKEKRSGLFQQEEILALKQCDDSLEEDIDVLD